MLFVNEFTDVVMKVNLYVWDVQLL